MSTVYTAESVLTSLGYADPFVAARQHARMILLGRLARYQATIHQFETQWHCKLDELQKQYTTQGEENFAADDDYLQWKWYVEAADTIKAQINAITGD